MSPLRSTCTSAPFCRRSSLKMADSAAGITVSSSPWSRKRGADAGCSTCWGESAGSSDPNWLKVRHERGPQLAHRAVVDVVHEGPRGFGQLRGHVAGLGEHGVCLVHVHERQLRRQQKRFDALAQAARPDPAARRRDRPHRKNHGDAVVVRRDAFRGRRPGRFASREVAHHTVQIAVSAERHDEGDLVANGLAGWRPKSTARRRS